MNFLKNIIKMSKKKRGLFKQNEQKDKNDVIDTSKKEKEVIKITKDIEKEITKEEIKDSPKVENDKEDTVKKEKQVVDQKTQPKSEVKKETNEGTVMEITNDTKIEPETKPKVEIKTDPKVETKTPKKDEPKKQHPKIEVLEPEQVTQIPPKMDLNYYANKIKQGERIDPNHQVEFLGLIHKEYVTNPSAPGILKESYKHFFDAQAAMLLLYQSQQTSEDCKLLGFNVPDESLPFVVSVFKETFGVTVKELPNKKKEDTQTSLVFETIPKGLKDSMKKDLEALKSEKVEVTVLSEDDKKWLQIRKVLAVMSESKALPLINAIELYKNLFNSNKEADEVLVEMINHFIDSEPAVLRVLSSIAYNCTVGNETTLLTHFMFKKWLDNKYTDKTISKIICILIDNNIHIYRLENSGLCYKNKGGTSVSKYEYEPGIIAINYTKQVAPIVINQTKDITELKTTQNTSLRIKGSNLYAGIKGFTGIDNNKELNTLITQVSELYPNDLKESKYWSYL